MQKTIVPIIVWLGFDTSARFKKVIHSQQVSSTTEITNGGESDGYRLSQSHIGFVFPRFRVQTLANIVHATGSEDRTPRRTHIFLSAVNVAHFLTITRTCLWLKAQEMFRTRKSSTHSTFHRPLLVFCLTHFHPFDPRHLLPHRQHCL